jgi:integrase
VKFTDKFIKSLKPKDKEYQIRDSDGFTIRILPSGVRRWEFVYKSPLTGKRRRMHLGNYSEAGGVHRPESDTTLAAANSEYNTAYGQYLKGIDPQAPVTELKQSDVKETVDDIITVSKLIDRYIESIDGHLNDRTVKHHKERLKNHILKALGEDRDIKSVKRMEALDLIKKIAKEKPGAARNAASSASALFGHAVEWGMMETNPFYKATKAVRAARPNKKVRFLNEDEIKHLVGQINGRSDRLHDIIMLLLFTGQRPNEVAGMNWTELKPDLINPKKNDRWWIIPQLRAQKNKQNNLVYLTSPVRRILRNTHNINKALDNSPHVFPATRGSTAATLVTTLDAFVEKRVGGEPWAGLSKWEPHDMRRTFATNISRIGCPFWVIDMMQDHKLAGQSVADDHLISQVHDNYNLYRFSPHRREWAIRWAWEIRRILRSK